MKYVISQLPIYLASAKSSRWNIRFLIKFVSLLIFQVTLYSYLFHIIMLQEGQDYSPMTGLYWTLTVMSTLGFGDITFNSDIGKWFTIVVLLTGVIFFMIMLPFTFIRFIYQPWIESKLKTRVPTELPEHTSGHVILAGFSIVTSSIVERLIQHHIPYVILVPDSEQALSLIDRGYHAILGEYDDSRTYQRLRVGKAAMVAALCDDLKNTNIASTVREIAPDVPIMGSVDLAESIDILRLAGANHVFQFVQMLGEAFAKRSVVSGTQANIVGRFDKLCIAEVSAEHVGIVGKNLVESGFRAKTGLNIVGIWERNKFIQPRPETVVNAASVLLLAGSAKQLEKWSEYSKTDKLPGHTAPALIIGGGRVGKAVMHVLEHRHRPFKVIENNPTLVPPGDDRYTLGSAADIHVLEASGIRETPSVLITTHNDDLNIYLTIYCRRLRPDVQIISRANLDRNINSLYAAGANVVMSHASMAANAVVNLLSPSRVIMLTEGLDIFKMKAHPNLFGVSLKDSNIRRDTDCNVIALRSDGELHINPDPTRPIKNGDELVLVGTDDAEKRFIQIYPSQ